MKTALKAFKGSVPWLSSCRSCGWARVVEAVVAQRATAISTLMPRQKADARRGAWGAKGKPTLHASGRTRG